MRPQRPVRILAKLPTRETVPEASPGKKLRTLVGESIIEMLEQLRYDPSNTKPARKKVNVPQGKSILVDDLPPPGLSLDGQSTSPSASRKRSLRILFADDSSDNDDDTYSVHEYSDNLDEDPP